MLGVRMLARSMARKAERRDGLLDADDLEQAALLELCRSLPAWDRCQPFEWFAWYAMRSGIADALKAISWRGYKAEIVGRAIEHGIDVSGHPARELIMDVDEVDGCVICGTAMPDRRPNAVYCSPSCRHKLNLLRDAQRPARPPRQQDALARQ